MITRAADGDAASGWVDHGVVPPRRLPATSREIAVYLTEALGHPVFERWTWTRLVKVYGALPDARRTKPTVCRLLVDATEVIEAWQRGRLHAAPLDAAPTIDAVVESLLKVHGMRFKRTASEMTAGSAASNLMADALPSTLVAWLKRRGRLANPHADTNTLGAADDHAAMAAFLRERASRSRHTWRAYTAELQRLAAWCVEQGRGPLSDLTRQDLLAFRQSLSHPATRAPASAEGAMPVAGLSQRTQARALAVVASLFRYWHDTGYLLGNPAASLSGGARSRAGFTPTRFVPSALLEACDAWVTGSIAGSAATSAPVELTQWRRAAIWTMYRCAGVRLSELEWRAGVGLPRLEVDGRGDWTLQVLGKGDKERAIPLPRSCAAALRGYRLARGLRGLPIVFERMPLIHGEKASSLGARGLYDEVKAVLIAVAEEIATGDPAGALLLLSVSPHWLRHAYARKLVVDKRVPLPVVQALLGHASVQTTAEYAKNDLSKLREFVELGFGEEAT